MAGKVVVRRHISGPYLDKFGEFYFVPLSGGHFAKISQEDVERVGKFNWCASLESRGTKTYAIRWTMIDGKQTKIRMHRFIKDLPVGSLGGLVVDHLGPEPDGLDNRRERLEVITQYENMRRCGNWKKKEEPSL